MLPNREHKKEVAEMLANSTGSKDGYQTTEIRVGNCTVIVHRPLLDAKEQARREELIKNAMRGFIQKGN